MTEQRKKLIEQFQRWLDTNPNKAIIAAQCANIAEQYHKKQLMLGDVASSSDLIVVELSDDELKIITMAELEQWKQSAIEFDGFEGWIVRGRLI